MDAAVASSSSGKNHCSFRVGGGGARLRARPISDKITRFLNKEIHWDFSPKTIKISTLVVFVASQYFGGLLVKFASCLFTGYLMHHLIEKDSSFTYGGLLRALAASVFAGYVNLKLS